MSGLVDGAERFPAPCQSSQVHGDGLVRPDGSSVASFPHAISTCFWTRFLTSDRFVSLKFVLKVKASLKSAPRNRDFANTARERFDKTKGTPSRFASMKEPRAKLPRIITASARWALLNVLRISSALKKLARSALAPSNMVRCPCAFSKLALIAFASRKDTLERSALIKLDPAKTDSRKSEPARFAPSNLDELKSVSLSISFVFEQPDQSMFAPASLEHEAVAGPLAPGASSSTTDSTPTFGVKRNRIVSSMFKERVVSL